MRGGLCILKEKFFYQYYENPGSITTGYRPGAWNVYKRMNQCLRQEFQETEDFDFTQQLNWHLLYYACNVIGMECACAKTRREAHEQIGNILSDKRLLEVFQQTQLDISWEAACAALADEASELCAAYSYVLP